MKEPKRYRVKNAIVEAMQIKEGVTTKGDILAFCPGANVGAPISEVDPEGMGSTDLRWVTICTVRQEDGEDAVYGDWIIKGPAGHFLRDCETFPESYEEIYSDADAFAVDRTAAEQIVAEASKDFGLANMLADDEIHVSRTQLLDGIARYCGAIRQGLAPVAL